MEKIPHWSGTGELTVARSAGGVMATLHPYDNLSRGEVAPWPPPEIIQKLYASERWRGATDEDDRAVRTALGHYCDLQSINSEDAITWSFFGPLVYAPPEVRTQFAHKLMQLVREKPGAEPASIWLWRRVPHPEKPGSTGGPEIDVGIHVGDLVVLGEAKWNSAVGRGQGVEKNRSQLDLRRAYCAGLGLKALSEVRRWIILGIGRTANILDEYDGKSPQDEVLVHNLSWTQLLDAVEPVRRAELRAYLEWKTHYCTARPSPRK
jgi:hypothetical protein